MRLVVLTPTATVVDDEVVDVRAEDPTGEFGLRPRHDLFVTALVPGVVAYERAGGGCSFVAVAGGMLHVDRATDTVRVVTPDAATGDDLEVLERTAVRSFRQRVAQERAAKGGVARLGTALLRRMGEVLRPDQRPAGRLGSAEGSP